MVNPPFRLAAVAAATRLDSAEHSAPPGRGADARSDAPSAHPGRARLAQLERNFYCSVIGTCLGTAELRRIVGRLAAIDTRTATDLEIHHEAVRLAHDSDAATRALDRALDRRHEAAIRRFARAADPAALEALWDEARRNGDIPGAYWALLTHRQATTPLRAKAFGDVHMLSHLVGAANAADIRRLVALERENAELHEQLERQQARALALAADRERIATRLRDELTAAAARLASAEAALRARVDDEARHAPASAEDRSANAQAERRERAERVARDALAEAQRWREQCANLREQADVLARELAAAEDQLEERADTNREDAGSLLDQQLRGQRILYVGGRPSAAPAIRDLVVRHGGEFLRHDGGIEDRKGLLAAAIAGAGLVVFPVDCVDHDSAVNLKRQCMRQGIAYIPLRTGSIASFIAGLQAQAQGQARSQDAASGDRRICIRHA